MPRPLRIEYEDAFYHVMNRGRDKQRIFHSADYFEAFLQSLDEAHLRFGMEVHAYCLMGNHYHLLIKTPQGNLSRIMRHIDGLYTQCYNRLKQTDGSLFRGRYKAIVIDASQYLLQVSRYIHRNPVDMKKPLVRKLEDYQWSSYATYLGQNRPPHWLNRDSVYGELASRQVYKAYANYVDQGNESLLSTKTPSATTTNNQSSRKSISGYSSGYQTNETWKGELKYTTLDCDEIMPGSGQRQTHRDSRSF